MYLPKVELERALVEAEQESEVAALQQEKEALEALHNKMADLETKSQQEKEKVFNRVSHYKTVSEMDISQRFRMADTETKSREQ